MTRVLFVGDGRRDAASVPPIVERILGKQLHVLTRPWSRLHEAGHGYNRKILYACRQARDQNADGLVATVDVDKDQKGARLRKLKKGREDDRQKHPAIPTALGEAVPHLEAWLLDDSVGVRTALQLDPNTKVPSAARTKDPKQVLQELMKGSPRKADKAIELCRAIATELDSARCRHGKETGFAAFVKEVESELGPIVSE